MKMLPLSTTELTNPQNGDLTDPSRVKDDDWSNYRYNQFNQQQLTCSAKHSMVNYHRYSGLQVSGNNYHRTPSYIMKGPNRYGQRVIRSFNRGAPRTGHYESTEPRHRRISMVFSYMGGFIFALLITRSFLHFETTTNVYIQNPQSSELPATSFCFFYDLKDHLHFTHQHVKGKDIDGYVNLTNKNLDQINQELPKFSEFVKRCEVLVDNDKYQTCLSVNRKPVVKYLSLYSKCYTMFEFINPPRKYHKREIGSNWLLSVTLNVSRISTGKVGIFLTHSTEELDESLGNPSFLQFDIKDNNRATVTYERTVIYKLPPPYNSNCFDYESLPCKNRATCIRRCIREKSFEGSKAWVNRRYVQLDEFYYSGRFGIEDETNYTEYCFRKFPSEPCTDYLYNAIMASQFLSPFADNQTFQINVAYPLGMETIVEYKEFQSLMDYICFVSSIVSLWTEASMIRISESLLDICTRLLLRFLQAEHVNGYAIGSSGANDANPKSAHINTLIISNNTNNGGGEGRAGIVNTPNRVAIKSSREVRNTNDDSTIGLTGIESEADQTIEEENGPKSEIHDIYRSFSVQSHKPNYFR